jgi:transketolase
MRLDKRVCSLLSDSGTDYDVMMARDMPNQCYNFGIAEQNKIAAASGMAAMGKIPFVYTTGTFLAYRAYEFIRNDICLQKRNVKIVGMGMGIGSWSTLGSSHHATEDVAVLRVIPNLALLSASTPLQLRQMVQFAYEHEGAVYIRMGMSAEEELYQPDYGFEFGKLSKLLAGDMGIAVFTTGTVAAEAYHAAKRIGAECHDVATIKPLDKDGVLSVASNSRMLFSVEEHQLDGGLGGAIAEVLADHGLKVPLVRIGLKDRFAPGYGTATEIRRTNGLDRYGIYQQININL